MWYLLCVTFYVFFGSPTDSFESEQSYIRLGRTYMQQACSVYNTALTTDWPRSILTDPAVAAFSESDTGVDISHVICTRDE